jgi:hypothetical protein
VRGPLARQYDHEMAFYEPGIDQNPFEIDFSDEAVFFPDRPF